MTATDTSRTRTYSWADPAALARAGAGLTGLELIRKFAAGELAPPPIIAMLEGSIVEADEGRVVFTLTPAEWMFNPIGSVHGGIAATILDSCMGCAVHTTLRPRHRLHDRRPAHPLPAGDDDSRPARCSPRARSCTPGAARRRPRGACSCRAPGS